jgi:hypothetical protein
MRLTLLLAAAGLIASSSANSAQLILNGDFATGNFTDWTLFTTSEGTFGLGPYPQVVMFNVTGSGEQNAAHFNVGQSSFGSSGQQGGGISQDITTSGGVLDFSAAIALFSLAANLEAGVFSVLLDGVVKTTDDIGYIGDEQTLRGALSFSAPVSAGVHQIEILVTRPYLTDGYSTPNQYLTDISATLVPIPEPSTWAMMGLGFACLGFLGYRASWRSGRVAV